MNSTADVVNPSEKLLTKSEVAGICRVKTRTIDNWMKKGFLPYYKVGAAVRFRSGDVIAHLAQNCRVVRG